MAFDDASERARPPEKSRFPAPLKGPWASYALDDALASPSSAFLTRNRDTLKWVPNVSAKPPEHIQAIRFGEGNLAMRAINTFDPGKPEESADYHLVTSEEMARDRPRRDGNFRILCDSPTECRKILREFHDFRDGRIAIPNAVTGLTGAIFLISIPKSGTHLFMNLLAALGYRPGLELRDNIYRPGHWYFPRGTNAHTEAYRLFSDDVADAINGNKDHPFQISPCIFGFRFPPSMLFSESRFYRKPENALFSAYYDGLSVEEMLSTLLHDQYMRGRFVDRVMAFSPYFRFPNVIPVSYEALALAGNPEQRDGVVDLVWWLQLLLALPGDPEAILTVAVEMESATLDQGKLLDPLSQEYDVRAMDPSLDDVCRAFGYAPEITDSATPSSSLCLSSRTAPPNLVLKKPEQIYNMPVWMDLNFLGVRIVRTWNRIFGVPSALGFQLPTMPRVPDQDFVVGEHHVYVGRTVEEVKLKIFGTELIRQSARKSK